MTRAELIATLVTDKYSVFTDGDEPILEAASDARLEDFRAALEARKTELTAHSRLESEHRNVAARLKVAEDRLKAAEEGPTEEEWLQRAPASIKTLIEAHKAQEDAERSALVSALKDLGANTEEELKKKPLDDLRMLAKYARVEVIDYSGKGLPVDRFASEKSTESYAPPDPYAAGIKALQAKSQRVN